MAVVDVVDVVAVVDVVDVIVVVDVVVVVDVEVVARRIKTEVNSFNQRLFSVRPHLRTERLVRTLYIVPIILTRGRSR